MMPNAGNTADPVATTPRGGSVSIARPHAVGSGESFPPLLFAAEGAKKILQYGRAGAVVWEYPAEMSRDVWRLPAGNVLFCYKRNYDSGKHDNPSGVMEVTPDKRVVFHFATTGQVWSCQRLADGNTLVFAGIQIDDMLARRRGIRAVRLPGIGDLYSVEFIAKVDAVIAANPQLLFWFYTRSWYSPVLWRAMQRLRRHPNLSMWLSWDRVMAASYGAPPDRDLPWCWLAETDDDLPAEPVSLVWRFDDLPWNKSLPEKLVLGGSLVCPHENGITQTTCYECGICWRGKAFREAKIARLLKEAK